MQLCHCKIAILILLVPDTYLIYKYMEGFFGKHPVNKRVTWATFIVYDVMALLLYIFVNRSMVLMLFNITAMLLLTFNFKAYFTERILSVALYSATMACIEHILYLMFDQNLYDVPIIPFSIAKIVLEFGSVYCIIRYFGFKNNVHLPPSIWLQLVLIPAVSLYLFIFLIFLNVDVKKSFVFIIGIIVIDAVAVRLYKEISISYEEKYKKIILAKQNEYYINHFELMERSIRERNSEKHDFKNHLSVISTLIQKNEQGKAEEYIKRIMDRYQSVKEYNYTGNLEIDSLINYKIQEAEKNDIKMNAELSIPENLQVDSYDMTIILGNIIDNAIQATKKIEKNRNIDLKINFTKGRLLITMTNPFNGEIKYENNRLTTLHEDKDNHGFGLSNVNAVLEKYNGTLDIEHTNNLFSLTILMFINHPCSD